MKVIDASIMVSSWLSLCGGSRLNCASYADTIVTSNASSDSSTHGWPATAENTPNNSQPVDLIKRQLRDCGGMGLVFAAVTPQVRRNNTTPDKDLALLHHVKYALERYCNSMVGWRI